MVGIENEFLRIEVAPELGGRVYSLFDKRIGKEILFSNPVVKTVRILPIWAFISGGIEFNFPIAHSPTSIATVGCVSGRTDDYAFIRVGEREACTGMEWVIELGLAAGSPVLVQRTAPRSVLDVEPEGVAFPMRESFNATSKKTQSGYPVILRFAAAKSIRRIRLLRAGKRPIPIPWDRRGNRLEMTIPKLGAFAALHLTA